MATLQLKDEEIAAIVRWSNIANFEASLNPGDDALRTRLIKSIESDSIRKSCENKHNF